MALVHGCEVGWVGKKELSIALVALESPTEGHYPCSGCQGQWWGEWREHSPCICTGGWSHLSSTSSLLSLYWNRALSFIFTPLRKKAGHWDSPGTVVPPSISSDPGSFCSWAFTQLQTECNFLLWAWVMVAPAEAEIRSLKLQPLVSLEL